MAHIDDLPDLTLEIIFSYLNQYSDLDSARLVSRRWLRVAHTVINILRKSFHRCNKFIWELCEPRVKDDRTIAKRCSHASCYHDSSKKVYIFGGCTDDYTAFNDLWSFDLRSRSWRREFVKCSPFPNPKAMAIFLPYKDYLILHGGFAKSAINLVHQAANFYNEIHMYDTITNEWIELDTYPAPPTVASHCGCVVKDSLIIFGGSQNSRATNAVHILNLISKKWYIPKFVEVPFKAANGNAVMKAKTPPPRYGSSCVLIDETHLIVVGGCGGPNCIYNDVWLLKFDLTLQTPWEWKEIIITNPSSGPSQLWCHPGCSIGRNFACISRLRNNNEQGYNTISLNSRPAPLQFASRNSVQLPSDSSNNNLARPQESHSVYYSQRFVNNGSDAASSSSQKNWNRGRQGTACTYILDTSKVLDDCTVTWRERQIDVRAPEDTILYSLVAGRGELIMFAGMRSEIGGTGHRTPYKHAISNDIYILHPPNLI